MARLTLVEKIATRYAVGLKPGEAALQGRIIRIRPKHVMTHDNTGAVIPKFLSIFAGAADSGSGAQAPEARIHDPGQPVFAIDHDIQNVTPENLGKYARIEKFAAAHGIDFYPAGTGISHQVMVEQGYAVPGALVVGSDSHSNMYGAVGALGTPVVRTDAACLWATGETWWQVPPVARCTLTGRLRPGVVGKDVIIALCGLFNSDEVLNHAVEFTGPGVESLSMDHRLSIANMTTEWGALAGVFPFDDVLKTYLFERADYFAADRRPGTRRERSRGAYTHEDVERWWHERLWADADAAYAIELTLDLATITPHVSGPNHVKTMTSVAEMQRRGVKINKAYLVSCVNARLADIAEAAAVARGKRVAEGVEFYIAAASADIQAEAERLGHWQDLIDAGAKPLPPGCGPCIGLGAGLVAEGEVAISATNRNFKGRMGSPEAEVYLGSPAVVAASAIEGRIAAPFAVEDAEPVGAARRAEPPTPAAAQPVEIIDGFPERIEGRVLYMPADNMNTDGIFAGKWTYRDDLTPVQMAQVVFENYDPAFGKVYRPGDLIVGGRNFGTGSSREQAATALRFRGIPCVIAASFSETYKRNAFNNGFLCLDCPGLVDHLAAALGSGSPTIPGPEITIDFANSTIACDDRTFPFDPLSTVAQELVVAGGAEAIARSSLNAAHR
ncbi:MAG TPA: homoaconitase [Phycisphaerales bacterium]|nr:homoaconitase [Phycisphaerales bacterium]